MVLAPIMTIAMAVTIAMAIAMALAKQAWIIDEEINSQSLEVNIMGNTY